VIHWQLKITLPTERDSGPYKAKKHIFAVFIPKSIIF